jgi:hypothetical protein
MELHSRICQPFPLFSVPFCRGMFAHLNEFHLDVLTSPRGRAVTEEMASSH